MIENQHMFVYITNTFDFEGKNQLFEINKTTIDNASLFIMNRPDKPGVFIHIKQYLMGKEPIQNLSYPLGTNPLKTQSSFFGLIQLDYCRGNSVFNPR